VERLCSGTFVAGCDGTCVCRIGRRGSRRFQDRRGRAGVVDAVELRPELGTHCFEAGAHDGH
jgi:hypothetical protein